MSVPVTSLPTVGSMSFVDKWEEEGERFALDATYFGLSLDRPGLHLASDEQDEIYGALVTVTTSSFGADMTEYWRGRREDGYFDLLREFTVVVNADGRIVGWTGFHRHDREAYTNLYVDSTGLVPDLQSIGLMKKLMRTRIIDRLDKLRGDERTYLSARSENPVFYRLMEGMVGAGNLFPHPNVDTPPDIRACARDLAATLGQLEQFDIESFIIRDAYGSLDALYGELPTTGDPDLDRFFTARLGPLDGLLLVSRVAG